MPRAPSTPKPPRTPRVPAPRYSIAEWYGKDIAALTPEERHAYGELATKQMRSKKRVIADAPVCPFLSTLVEGARCNKKGGVCSIRRYTHGGTGDATLAKEPGDKIVTTCPSRFIQNVNAGKSIFTWIAEKMLDTSTYTLVKETPFLRKISNARMPVEALRDAAVAGDIAEEEEEEKKAGRIDWIVVNPASMEASELAWAAIETQALYFSGDGMMVDFEAYAAGPSPILFPIGQRRPDYRSNGPKRLAPQLDVKVPVLGAWGKKVAVVVDQFFFDNMNQLEEAFARARDDRARRDNAEVIWFVVDYDEQLRLRARGVHYTTLVSSRKALNATEPLSKGDFTDNLKGVINNPQRTNKVFKASE